MITLCDNIISTWGNEFRDLYPNLRFGPSSGCIFFTRLRKQAFEGFVMFRWRQRHCLRNSNLIDAERLYFRRRNYTEDAIDEIPEKLMQNY